MDFSLMDFFNTTYRAFISLITLFLITKLIGKRQVAELSLFDYVIGISIGNFAAEMTINLDSNEINGIVSVIIFGFIAYAVSYLTLKSKKARKFFTGGPTLLIQNGKIIADNMKKVKFDLDDLLEICRCNGYFDINQIEYALMEANGELSFLPKVEYKPVTVGDLDLKIKQDSLVANILMDGKIIESNLEKMGKDVKWLKHELKVKGYKEYDDILLVTLDINDKITIYEKEFKDVIKNVVE